MISGACCNGKESPRDTLQSCLAGPVPVSSGCQRNHDGIDRTPAQEKQRQILTRASRANASGLEVSVLSVKMAMAFPDIAGQTGQVRRQL